MRRPRPALVVAIAVAVLVAACSGGGEEGAPDPIERPPRPTTTRVDHTGVVLGVVPGETTTTVAASGRAAIVGSVRGPSGAIAEAVVRIERLAPGGPSTDVVADGEGRYELRGVPGGRYRIRAFLPPALVQTQPEIRFLEDAVEHRFDLEVEDRSGPVVMASVAPNPPLRDQAVNLVVQIGTRRVDGDGVVRTEPVPDLQVELSGLGAWQLASASPTTTTTTRPGGGPPFTTTTTTTAGPSTATATTDGAGRARWELVCRSTGPPGLSIRYAVRRPALPAPEAPPGGEAPPTPAPEVVIESAGLDLPACIDPTTLTTPPTTAGTPTTTGGTDGGGTTTTPTTAPDTTTTTTADEP
jgi:hypothetical protein